MRIHKIKPQKEFTEAKARITARLKGDGTFCRTGTNYIMAVEGKDEELIANFINDMDEVYGLRGNRYRGKSGKTGKPLAKVMVRSKLAYKDLQKYGPYRSNDWRIPKEVFKGSDKIKKEFLKTFFDDEGSVVQGEVRLYSINLVGLKEIQQLLEAFKMQTKIKAGYGLRRNVYGIVIKDVRCFANKLGFNLSEKKEKLKSILTFGQSL